MAGPKGLRHHPLPAIMISKQTPCSLPRAGWGGCPSKDETEEEDGCHQAYWVCVALASRLALPGRLSRPLAPNLAGGYLPIPPHNHRSLEPDSSSLASMLVGSPLAEVMRERELKLWQLGGRDRACGRAGSSTGLLHHLL